MKRSTLGILTECGDGCRYCIVWIQEYSVLIDNPNGNYGNLVLPLLVLFVTDGALYLNFLLKALIKEYYL
jgi:hypothetical protein